MTIESVGKNSLRFYLSQNETELLFGNYQNIDYKNQQTKSALNKLLRAAQSSHPFFLDSNQLSIEVKPCIDGCLIQMTKKSTPRRLHKVCSVKTFLFVFNECNALMDACVALKSAKIGVPENKLYQNQHHEWMLWIGKQPCREALRLLRQYSQREYINPYLLSVAGEYTTCICAENAVSKIAEPFTERRFNSPPKV